MDNKITQPSAEPTRKLSAAILASALMSVAGLIIRANWPQYYDDATWSAVTPVVAFLVGYFVKDTA